MERFRASRRSHVAENPSGKAATLISYVWVRTLSLFFGVGGSGRRPLESADPEGGLGELVDRGGTSVWLEAELTKL